ncbi:hypothetical protein VaNZ11_001796, partial [Volvox africanus]
MASRQERGSLHDISNVGARHTGAPGKPSKSPPGKAQMFIRLIEAGGVMGWTTSEDTVLPGSLEVADPRRLRSYLESRLQRDPALREQWLEALQEACEDEEVLHRALVPMSLAVAPSVGSGPGSGTYLGGGVGGGGGGGSCGDSFMRCVLGVACLQASVATWLLQRLPVLAMAEPAAGTSVSGALDTCATGGVPGLILGQLRWLDVLPDAGGDGASSLVDVVLEVLPLTPPAVQRQLIGLLPELASVDDHARIVEKLGELLDSELGFVAPTLEALQQLQLGPELQDQVVLDMAQRLPGVDSDDLPALVRFVVQYSTGPPATAGIGARGGGGGSVAVSAAAATAPSVFAVLRGGLPMVDLNDPRVNVPDPKGKRGGGSRQEPVEVRILRELVVALTANDAAAGAVLRAISAAGSGVRMGPGGSSAPDLDPVTADIDDALEENLDSEGRDSAAAAAALADGPQKLVPLDLWILLALLGGRRGKEADKILRAKICDGTASPSWLSSVLLRHSAALREMWSAAMSLSATLASSNPSGGPLATASARLYAVMFTAMSGQEDSLQRIEVLHALHSHLGSGVREEVDTALGALAQLAEGPLSRSSSGAVAVSAAAGGGPSAPALSLYGSALSNCLDHLESFTDSQLARLFDVLAAVTGGAEGVAWRAATEARSAAASDGAAGGRGAVVRIAGGAGGRLESEVQIVVDKALKGSASYKRIGIAGSLAFLRRVGCALMLLDGGCGGGGGSGGSSIAGGGDGFDLLLREWRGRLDDLIAATEGHGAARALALGLISEMIKTPAITTTATATAGAKAQAPVTPLAGCWGAKLPAAALEQLTAVVQTELLERALVVDLPLAAAPASGHEGDGGPRKVRVAGCAVPFSCSVWLNVDEQETSVAINLWPLAASSAITDRDVLVWMAPCLSLVCLVSRIVFGDLQDVDGLLGCPLVMFPMELLQDDEGINHLHELPPVVSAAVLTCLQAASSWLKEIINCFSPALAAQHQGGGWGESGTAKLAKRSTQLAVLEALAAALVDNIPPPRGGLAALQALRSHADPLGRFQKCGAGNGGAARSSAAAVIGGVKRGGRAAAGDGGGGGGTAGGSGSSGGGGLTNRTAAVLGFRRCVRPLSLSGTVETLRHLLTACPPGVYGGSAEANRRDGGGGGKGDDDGGEDEMLDPRNWAAWTVLPIRLAAASYLISELAAKAAVVAARARNAPAFALSGSAVVAAADTSLEGMSLGKFAVTLAGVMPYVRKHLDSATAALAGARILTASNNTYLQPTSDGDGQRLLTQLDAVQAPLESSYTAAQYVMNTLDLLRIFFGAFAPPGAGGGGGAAGRGRGRAAGGGGAAAGSGVTPSPQVLAAVLACLAAKPATEGAPDADLKKLAAAACPAAPGRALNSAQGEGLALLALRAFQQLTSQCQGAGLANPGGSELAPQNPPASPDVWRELALLRTGRALIAAVRHLVAPDVASAAAGGWPDGLRRLAKAVSRSANKALENDWSGSGGAAAAGGGGGGGDDDGDGGAANDDGDLAAASGGRSGGAGGSFRWRGQAKLILEFLRIYVDLSTKPLDVLKLLVTQAMSEVPAGKAGGGRGAAAAVVSEPIAGYASLGDATLAAWYRGVFEALLERWSATCAQMRASERRVLGQEEEEQLMVETLSAAEVFSKLMELVKKHPGRTPLITAAIKCGGKFVEDLARSTGAWRRLWEAHEDKLRRTVKSVQRGTRLLNTLCAEGKERRAVALAAKVPAVKRAMETFLLNMRALFHEMGCADGIRIAQLKNKDIHGNEVASQAYGGYNDADADGGGDDGGGEDRDEGEEHNDAGANAAPADGHDARRNGRKKLKGAGEAGHGKRVAGGAAATEGDGGERDGAPAGPKAKKPRAPRAPKEELQRTGSEAAAPRARKLREPRPHADCAAGGVSGDVGADAAGRVKSEEVPEADIGPSALLNKVGKRPRTATDAKSRRKMMKAAADCATGCNGGGGSGGSRGGGGNSGGRGRTLGVPSQTRGAGSQHRLARVAEEEAEDDDVGRGNGEVEAEAEDEDGEEEEG